MGADDDADCVEHVWRLDGVTFGPGGSDSEYACIRCEAVLVVGPGAVHPQTL